MRCGRARPGQHRPAGGVRRRRGGRAVRPGALTRGAKGFLYCSLAVRASAPIVRPWKPLEHATNSVGGRRRNGRPGRPPASARTRAALRQNLIAASFASVPELQKNALDANLSGGVGGDRSGGRSPTGGRRRRRRPTHPALSTRVSASSACGAV